MHNWSSNLARIEKHPQQFKRYQLEQLINFGLCGQKLRTKDLMENWSNLTIDPHKKTFLKELLWPKKS